MDIRPALESAASAAGIPLQLALACALAESGLNPRAERWGGMTGQAQQAIAAGDNALLQAIIDETWPDISFGYSQKIVEFHYLGDHSQSVDNCLAVRAGVFADPDRNLVEMTNQLAGCMSTAQAGDLSPAGGDPLLAALIVYNAGHLPAADSSWWSNWSGNVTNYKAALDRAAGMV